MPTVFDPRAVPLSGVNLVEASAGTGKTHAITDLYERLVVERGCGVEEILVVTYTKAATAELRERIRERLVSRLTELRRRGPNLLTARSPASELTMAERRLEMAERRLEMAERRLEMAERRLEMAERRLEVATQRFDQAAVFTIHGFCQRALDDSAFEGGQPFSSELVVDGDALVADIVRDFWRQETAKVSASWAYYLLAEGGGPDALFSWVRPLVARSHLHLVVPVRTASVDLLRARYQARFDEAYVEWQRGRDAVQALLLDSPALNRARFAVARVPGWLLGLDQFFEAGHDESRPIPKDVMEWLRRVSPEALIAGTKKGQVTPSHPFFACAEAVRKAASDLAEAYAADLAAMRQKLLLFVRAELARRNRENRTRTFDDLLLGLDDALHPPVAEPAPDRTETRTQGKQGMAEEWGLASALRRRFPYALIDEFQDTDPVQLSIFRAIYGGLEGAPTHANVGVFLVGDPKQAIYGFRGADVFAYLQGRAGAARVYTLDTNRRSVSGLVHGVNRLFARVTDPFVVNAISYQTVTAGRDGALLSLDEESAEPFRVWQLPEREDGRPWVKDEARMLATQATAGAIRALVHSGARGSARIDGRPLSGGDIAVLVRTNRDGQLVQDALSAVGIRSVCTGSTNVFASEDATYVEWLLAAVCAPRRETAVRAVLASPVFERTGNELDALAQDEHRWDVELAEFYRWRDLWNVRGFGPMYRDVLESAGVAVRVLGRPFGERRMTNLLHLGELLQQAEVSLHASPEELLAWLSSKRRGGMHGDEEAEQRLESDEALVRVVTVHRAKGLQYPIVFCPFLWDAGVGKRTSNNGVIFHDEEAGDRAVLDLSIPPGERASGAAERESLSESVRLLYVALTRAQERLYLVWGSAKGAEHSALAWLLRPAPAASPGLPRACEPTDNASEADGGKSTRRARTKGAAKQVEPPGREYRAAWDSLRLESPDDLIIEPLPGLDRGPISLAPALTDGPELKARRFRGQTEQRWRVASFTSLTSELSAEVPDHDADVPSRNGASGSETVVQIPRGARAGTCIHAMLERLELTRPVSEQHELVTHALGEHGFDRNLAPNLIALLARVLEVDLRPPTGLRLSGVGASQRIAELEFYFPVRSVNLRVVIDLARAHGYMAGVSSIAAQARIAGFLKGYIDLIFEQQGRYYIVDYKTHWLGRMASDYWPDRLQEVMRSDTYELQYLIYSVALHRYLRVRLRNYDYERNFGGALYLFVRGMGLGPTGNGIYFDRPPAQLIHSIDSALGV